MASLSRALADLSHPSPTRAVASTTRATSESSIAIPHADLHFSTASLPQFNMMDTNLDASTIPEFVLIAPPSRTNLRTQERVPSLCEAWCAELDKLPEAVSSRFKVKETRLDPGALAQEFGTFECLVSPANSFGIMDGGSVPTSESS